MSNSKAKSAAVWLCVAFVALLSIAKLWCASVSIDGRCVRDLMVSDHWNFARNIAGGKLLYRDLVDHKGLYLFVPPLVLQAIAGTRTTWVIPISEAALFAATCASFFVFARRGCGCGKATSALHMMVAAAITFAASAGVPLLNTEGYAGVVVLLSYAYAFRDGDDEYSVSPAPFLAIGAGVGVLSNMKFTMALPFFPAFVVAAALHMKGSKKNVQCGSKNAELRQFNKVELQRLVASVFAGIAGFVAVNVPFVIYLAKHKLFYECAKVFGCAMQQKRVISLPQIATIATLTVVVVYLVQKDKIAFAKTVALLLAVIISMTFGAESPYYLAFYTLLLTMALVSANAVSKAPIAVIVIVFAGRSLFYPQSIDVDAFKAAKSLGMNDANTMSLYEDYGFGIFSDELFEEPLQWIPSRMFYSDAFVNYLTEETTRRLSEQRFKYVVCPAEVVEYTKTEDFRMELEAVLRGEENNRKGQVVYFAQIVPILETYYEPCVNYGDNENYEEYDFVYVAK